MYLGFILLLIGLYFHLFPLLQMFQCIPIKKVKDPRKLWLVMNIISMFLIIISGIMNEVGALVVIIFLAFFPGYNIGIFIYGLVSNPNMYDEKNTKTIILKKEDYNYVTQESTPIGGTGIVLPIGQDFPYISNYLYLPKTDEYILFSTHALNEPHDIEVIVTPAKDCGNNVYVCVELNILDVKKSILEKYFILVKYLVMILIIVGAVPLSYALTCVQQTPPNTVFPEWVSHICSSVLCSIAGGTMVLISQTRESKLAKIFWILLGSFLLLGGTLVLLFGK